MATTALPVAKSKKKSPARKRDTLAKLEKYIIPAHRGLAMIDFPELILPPSDLPYDDGVPLESNWHRAEINLLIESYQQYRHPQHNFYAGGNMFVYYSSRQALNRDFRGPDFFVALNVDGKVERKSWIVWEENGRYPNVIVELMSISTADVDKNAKKELYAHTFGTQNYFYYDPETFELTGFHLVEGEYVNLLPNELGHLWCEALGLWMGHWTGEYQAQTHRWIRFYDANGNLVLTGKEAESQRAEAEAQRAKAAEEELIRMRNRLNKLGIDPNSL